MNEYYSVERFKNAYKRLIEPLPDRSQWVKADLELEIGAPLGRRSVGRQRKNRIKGALEGGSGGKKKTEKLVCNYEGMKTEKKKKRIKGPTTCRNCGLLGHRASSYKCELNGTKKRKRQPRKNTTKNWFPPQPSSTSTLGVEMGEGSSSQLPNRRPARKLAPKKNKNASVPSSVEC